jgi:hypothetical protein
MSYLHILKDKREETWHLKDGYSDSLHRHVDLDSRAIISILGNQPAGRYIDVSGQLGRQLMALAKKFWKRHDKEEPLFVGKWSMVQHIFPSDQRMEKENPS